MCNEGNLFIVQDKNKYKNSVLATEKQELHILAKYLFTKSDPGLYWWYLRILPLGDCRLTGSRSNNSIFTLPGVDLFLTI